MTSGSLISADRSLETPRVRALPSQPASKTPAPQPWTRALRPWASTLILALLPFTALAQANFQLGDVITRDQVGARAELPLVLTHAGRAPASFTVDVDFDSANLNFITIRPAAALTTLTKNLIQSLPQAGKLRISVSGNPSAPLPQGLIATIVFEAATAPVRLSTRALQISNSSALDITSASLTVTSQPGQIRFRERPGDADLNDIVNALDLQVLINSILGLTTPPPPPTDVNLDGNVNALDLQLTINGILGVPILSSLSSTSLVNGAALFVTGNNFYGSTPGRVVVALNGSDATPFFVDDRNLAILVPATATTGALALRDTVTSNLSGPLSITLTSPPPPAAPSMTSAAAMGTTSISLTWFDESGTETGFRVERRNFPSGSFATVANLASDVTSYLDSTLAPNTSYEFRVFAFNLSGSSAASPAASATTAGAPAISAIIPNRGSSTKSTDVQIIGSNLTAGSQILIGGDPVLEPVFISPSLIIARTPIASAAERGQQVAVSLSGGNSLPAAWLYLTETRPLDVTASIPASFTPTAPISTSVAFRLSEQVDAATVTNPNTSATGNTAFFNSATPRQPLAGQARLSEDGLWIVLDTTLALTSSANQNLPLIVGGSSGIRDIFGNTLGTTNTTLGANPAFTASFVSNQAADTISPTLLSSSPAAGASNIARAASFEIIFSEALDPSSLRLNGASPSIGLTVSGGPAIPAKLKLSLDGRRIELTPLSAMSPSTMVRLSLNAGVTDLSGNALAPQNLDFTTRATSSLSLISVAPNLGSLGGDESIVLDGEGFAGFAEVLIGGRPASRIEVLSSSRIRCATPAASLPGPVDVSISFAGSTPITLASGFTYREDLSPSGSIQRPELLFEFPPAADDGSLPVAANSAYVLVYSEPLDISASSIGYGFDAPISLVQNNFTMNGSVSVVPNSRNRILLVRPSQNLSGTIRLFLSSFESFDNSGIKDTDGNRMLTFHADAFSQIGFGDAGFIFQWTGAAADSTPPTISSRSPTANSVIGPRDPIRIRFNEEIDPNAINGSFFSDSQGIVPGTIELELDSLRALTFRPSRDYSGTVTVNPAGIKDLAGNNTSSTTYTLTAGSDTLAPVITRLTVNNLPGSLNGAAANGGSAPSGQGLIQVPTSGFTIDLDVTELGGSGLDLDASQLTFSVAAGALSAGSNVLAALPSAFKSFDGERLTILIPEALALTPSASLTLTLTLRDLAGNTSSPASFIVRSIAPRASFTAIDDGQENWSLAFERDFDTHSLNFAGYSFTGTATDVSAPDGRFDFDSDLEGYGLFSTAGQANVNSGALSMNRAAKHWVANRIAYHIARLYGLAADFTDGRNNPGFAAYRPQTNRPERGDIALRFEPTDSGHGPSSNRLAFGGFVASGSLGVAAFDVRNADHDDDNGTTAAFLARGVFSSGDLSRNYDGSPPNANGIFRASFDPLSPFSASGAPRGTPLGEHPDDPFICDPNQNPATFSGARLTRYLNVLRAMDTLAARLASTAAHEIGHSLGLIDDGAPPSGLYGGDPTNYPGSTPSHILLREGYPSVGQNVMAPSSGFEADVSIFGSFNELAEAYMRNQVIIEPTQ